MSQFRPLLVLVSLFMVQPSLAGPANEILVPENFPTLEQAVASATAGDTISLASGGHGLTEGIVVSVDNLTIRGRTGTARDVEILEGGLSTSNPFFRIQNVDGFTLRDVKILNAIGQTANAAFIFNSSDTQFLNVEVVLSGGAFSPVLVNDSNVLFQDCFFDRNHSDTYGGAVRVVNSDPFDSRTAFVGCNFDLNESNGDGGAIAIAQQIDPKTVVPGGAILVDVTGCTFQDSVSTNGEGGAISIFTGSNKLPVEVSISDSFFGDNRAVGGGAIAVDRTNLDFDISVLRTHFNINKASGENGGAILEFETPRTSVTTDTLRNRFQIESSTFEKNIATSAGGGVAVEEGLFRSEIAIEESTFIENKGVYGGVLDLGSKKHLLPALPKPLMVERRSLVRSEIVDSRKTSPDL